MNKSRGSERGWSAEIDDEQTGGSRWQPYLQLDDHVASLSLWFQTEEDCLDFIRTDVIGRGMWPGGGAA